MTWTHQLSTTVGRIRWHEQNQALATRCGHIQQQNKFRFMAELMQWLSIGVKTMKLTWSCQLIQYETKKDTWKNVLEILYCIHDNLLCLTFITVSRATSTKNAYKWPTTTATSDMRQQRHWHLWMGLYWGTQHPMLLQTTELCLLGNYAVSVRVTD